MKHAFFSVLILILCSAIWFTNATFEIGSYFNSSYGSVAQVISAEKELARMPVSSSLLFVGDVMLARDVEDYLRKYGSDYPFRLIEDTLWEHEYVIGNFEAAVPTVHAQTPDLTFQFSVASDYLTGLQLAGFTHLSLANNHTFDYGVDDFEHTRTALRNEGLVTFGHPNQATAEESVTSINTTIGEVALLSFNDIYEESNRTQAIATLSQFATTTIKQIVYVHWGSEYQLTHSRSQQLFAEDLIDAGADLIIGHHPHVVQDIDIYQGVPIVYSLGNFVFDQYFSDEVQTGLLVSASFGTSSALTLMPVSSLGRRVSPYLLDGLERQNFLRELAARSTTDLQSAIMSGVIIF